MLRARFGLDTVWSRLLGTLALVVIPTAILSVLLAYSLFAAALASLSSTQLGAVNGRSAALQSWLDSAGRSLVNESFAARYVGAEGCAKLAGAFLGRNPGFASVRFFDEKSASCTAGGVIEGSAPPLDSAAADSPGYKVLVLGEQLWIIVQQAEGRSSVLIVDEKLLRERILPSDALGETHVALVGSDGAVAARSALGEHAWLPSAYPETSSWRNLDRAGATASFAVSPIEGSALRVLMRFDDRTLNAAWRRFYVLCAAQLAMMALLAYFYAKAIRRDVVGWIQGIDRAAQARGADFESVAKAPVAATMPRELRSVAESFNTMADHAFERQQALRASLAENRALMLEMHHRIKNSLQVIQSYLSLIRRAAGKPEALILARIEARVGVLAIAYRLALTPNGMRPISIKPFVEEICAAAVGGLRRPRQRVAYSIAWEGELIVDRAIPLGLGLAEALIAAFGATEAGYVDVHLIDTEQGVELRVESDVAPTEIGLPDKVMRGLANQLGATVASDGGGAILVWRFHA